MVVSTCSELPRVLVIDDEIGPRESMRILLKNEYEVLCAESVEKGMDLLRRTQPDAVVLDIRMPGKTGIEGLKEIRQVDPNVSVIMLTGFGTLDSAQEALRHGANEYMEKPFDAGEMRRVIRDYVHRSELARKRARIADELDTLNQRLASELSEKEHLASLGQASAEFVHDLRNSLMVAYGSVELLTHELDGIKSTQGRGIREVTEYLCTIDRTMRRCNEMLDSWQRLIKRDPEARTAVDVDEILREVVRTSIPVGASTGVRIVYESGPQDCRVAADRVQLARAVQNIIHNSLQAVPRDGGVVYVAYTVADGKVDLRVEDNGCGIEPQHLDRVLTPYFSTKCGKGGMGLGLFITKKIIESHAGTIRLESQMGQGTTVLITLPLAGG